MASMIRISSSVDRCLPEKVIAILASKETAKDLGLKFYKGISLDSTEDEVAAVLDHMQSGDNGALYGIRMGDYEYLSVSLKDGSVNDKIGRASCRERV